MIAETSIMVAMRDGARLATDVYRPSAHTASPAVLYRTPYGRDTSVQLADLLAHVEAGYAVVIQDTRGRFASDGAFDPFVDEADDGEDAIG